MLVTEVDENSRLSLLFLSLLIFLLADLTLSRLSILTARAVALVATLASFIVSVRVLVLTPLTVVIAESIPVELPKIAQAYFTGEVEDVTINSKTMQMIEKLSALIGRDGSSRLAYLAADALKKMWIAKLLPDESEYDEEISHMFDFTASGIIGIISRYGRNSDIIQLKESLLLISTLFSKTALEFISSKQVN